MNRTFKYFLFFLYLTSCFLFISCRGRTGQAGPSGPDGSVLAVFQPGASPSAYYSGESDTYISSGSAYSGLNYGGSYSAPAGPYSGGFGTRRILIKFDISGSIPPGAVVTGADLELYCSYAGGSNTLTAYNLARSWMEGAGTGKAVPGATWNSDGTNPWAGGAYGAAAGTPVFCSTADENFFVDFPVDPKTAQSWVDDPAGNYGLIIIASNEDTTANDTITFYTKEYGSNYAPALKIYYKPG